MLLNIRLLQFIFYIYYYFLQHNDCSVRRLSSAVTGSRSRQKPNRPRPIAEYSNIILLSQVLRVARLFPNEHGNLFERFVIIINILLYVRTVYILYTMIRVNFFFNAT